MPRVGRQALLIRFQTLADHGDSEVVVILLTVQRTNHQIDD